MTLRRFLDRPTAPERSLVVVNRRAPTPVQRMLESLFGDESVSVEEASIPDADDDQVLLVEDGAVVATSPLERLQDTILFVNSDLFITGTRELADVELPDVLRGLEDTSFSLHGYPEAHKEKLLLILVSRYIERRAWERGEGTLRSSFQRLSRIEDEVGTDRVYALVDGTDVDVHVYGTPGWQPDHGSTITTHAGYEPDFRDSWFVVYDPPAGDSGHIALLAVQQRPNEWEGFWTTEPSLVTDVTEYVAHRL